MFLQKTSSMKMTVWFNYANYTVGTENSFFGKSIRIVFLISLYFNCVGSCSLLRNLAINLNSRSSQCDNALKLSVSKIQ